MGVTPAYLRVGGAASTTSSPPSPVGRHRVLVCHNISCWMQRRRRAAARRSARRPAPTTTTPTTTARPHRTASSSSRASSASAPATSRRWRRSTSATTARSTAATRVAAIEALRAGDEPLPDKAISRRPRRRRARARARPPRLRAGRDACLRPGSSSATSTTPGLATIEGYRAPGGYRALERAFSELDPDGADRRRSRTPACAAAAAPASRWARRARSCPAARWRSTSAATPTSPSRGRSRTAS